MPDAKQPTGIRFLEWMLAKIREKSDGLLQDGELFDERQRSLTSLLNKEMKELKGITCLVSLPKMAQQSGEPEDSDSHTARVLVYIRCKPMLTKRRDEDGKLDSFLLAMKLYEGLNGEHFERDVPGMPANVTTTNLNHNANDKRGIEHLFEVRANITL